MNGNTPFTDLHRTDFSTNDSNEILYNELFSFCKPKPRGFIKFNNALTTPAPYDIILEQNRANYGSSYLPDTVFLISTHFGTEINLIRLTPRNNELFRLSRPDIEGQYDRKAFKTDLKTYGYWLDAPDSKHSSGYWKSCRKYIPLANVLEYFLLLHYPRNSYIF